MEFLLAAAVGGVVTQGVRYAWSYVSSPSTGNDKISPEQSKAIVAQQESIKKETTAEIKKVTERIQRKDRDAPLTASVFLSEIQKTRNSLRPTTTVKSKREKTDLELTIENAMSGRRSAMSDSVVVDSPTSPLSPPSSA